MNSSLNEKNESVISEYICNCILNLEQISYFFKPKKSKIKCRLANGSAGKESACNTRGPGDAGSIPGLGRSPVGGNGNPFQYFCLKNPTDRGV